MPGWMGCLLPTPYSQWVVVGWPSDPASPSSHPPSTPAKLVHGKCSLTSFPRLSQDFPPVAASSFARSVLKKAGPCKSPHPCLTPGARRAPLDHLRPCGSLTAPGISPKAALAAREESWTWDLPAGHHPNPGHHCWTGCGENPTAGSLGLGHIHGNVGVLVSTWWSRSGVRFLPVAF